jgi:hypothetical protein
MMRHTLYSILAIVCLMLLAAPGHATIFIDFDDATYFPPDSDSSFYGTNTYPTAYGNIDVTGRVWNKLGGDTITDHTPGSSRYFLKNTSSNTRMEIAFDFDVSAVQLYWIENDTPTAQMSYDVYNGTSVLDSGSDSNNFVNWKELNFSGYAAPITRIKVTGSGGLLGIDDVTVTRSVPEPLTALLFGTGLLGLAGARRSRQ